MQYADFVVLDFGELFGDDVGYEVASSSFGREGDLFLEPGHCVCGWRGA
jgi:hypothetical protein